MGWRELPAGFSGFTLAALLSMEVSQAIRSSLTCTSGSRAHCRPGGLSSPPLGSLPPTGYTRSLHSVLGQQSKRVKAEAARSLEPKLELV